jgi:3-hydroxy-9,10-secoandrosta-1,3,5(10)-triene-9,17-dione monooxygenase
MPAGAGTVDSAPDIAPKRDRDSGASSKDDAAGKRIQEHGMAKILERTARKTVYPIPEPDLTPQEVIARAIALRPKLRAEQDQAEKLGHYTDDMHREFLKAGFYRIVQPRMFGGYEFDIPTFYKTMLEVSRGHPGAGWCLTLCASHPFVIGSHWSEKAQIELFGPNGFFAAPHRPPPLGTATPAPGGYIIEGVWDYCSGIPFSSHLIGGARVMDGGTPPRGVNVVVPKNQLTVLADWGDDQTLGMRASGSNSVKVDKVFVPEYYVTPADGMWAKPDGMEAGTPGTRLHGNPMYLGRAMGPYHMSLVTPTLGAARAAIDEFETIIKNRPTLFPPVIPRYQHVDFQRAYGQAASLADASEGILMSAGHKYMDYCRRWAVDGTLFTLEDSIGLWAMIQHAGRLAGEAMDVIYAASSSASTKRGQKIERYYRDVAMYRSHISAQYLNFAAPLARAHFGLELGLFGF